MWLMDVLEVHKRCWQVDGTSGTGVLWQNSVTYRAVSRFTCCGGRAMVDVP